MGANLFMHIVTHGLIKISYQEILHGRAGELKASPSVGYDEPKEKGRRHESRRNKRGDQPMV